MKKKLFILGIILIALGAVTGIPSLIGAYLGSGTRLLTLSTSLGHMVRYAPIGLMIAGVLLLAGILMAVLCYAPSEKSLQRKAKRAEAKAAKEAARQAAQQVPQTVQTADVPPQPSVSPVEPPVDQPQTVPTAEVPEAPQETIPEPATIPDTPMPPAPTPVEASTPTGPICPACGTRNLPGSIFCTECGQRL